MFSVPENNGTQFIDRVSNRSLTVVKSRGTGHSNQVRELILSSEGLNLSDRMCTQLGERC